MAIYSLVVAGGAWLFVEQNRAVSAAKIFLATGVLVAGARARDPLEELSE